MSDSGRRSGRGRQQHAGFTLVEVLVALSVMAVMAVMAWQGVDGIVRARDASQARLESTVRLNTVVAQWEQDLASIQESLAVPSALACDGATVRLTRHAPGGLQVVAWSLRPDTTGGESVWTRWASPVTAVSGELQDSWLRSLQLQGNEPGQLRALTGLTQWQVYFFQGAWANCQSTGNVVGGSGNARAALPGGVRLVLAFAPGSGLAGNLTRDVRLSD